MSYEGLLRLSLAARLNVPTVPFRLRHLGLSDGFVSLLVIPITLVSPYLIVLKGLPAFTIEKTSLGLQAVKPDMPITPPSTRTMFLITSERRWR